MVGIYMYENKLNGKKYIGQSINIIKRKNEHETRIDTASKFDKHLQKLGTDCFTFTVLEECPSNLLNEREKYWIAFYDTTDPEKGYNLTPGGTSQRGEDNIQAKLSEQEVLEIIKLLEQNELTDMAISKIYNVHYNTISNINRCYTWTNLHNYTKNIRNEFAQKHFNRSSHAGMGSSSAKITEDQAKQVIKLLETTTLSKPQIAKQLNISLYIIEDISRCKTWKHLHNYIKNIRKECKGG